MISSISKILYVLGSTSIVDLALATGASNDNESFYHTKARDDTHCHTMPPNPNPYQVTYPDGTKSPLIRIMVDGQLTSPSHNIYEETLDGFTVRTFGDDVYHYVEVDNATGEYVDTGLTAGIDDPYLTDIKQGEKAGSKLRKNVANERQNILLQKRSDGSIFPGEDRKLYEDSSHDLHISSNRTDKSSPHRRAVITTGTLKNLVIPFKFKNHSSRNVPSRSELNTLMNNVGPDSNICPTGSVRDVYLESSFNQLDVDSTVVSWVTIDYTESYCANGSSALSTHFHICLRNALDKVVARGTDLRDFDLDNDGYIDGIAFFHSGYAAEFGGIGYENRIWSHKWALWTQDWSSNGVQVFEYHISPALWGTSGSQIGRIGVVAHETGHFLGLPDLYDYGDYTFGTGSGIGSYGLMANSWGFDGSQYHPPIMSAWSKIGLGWINPTVVSSSGYYSLRQACDYPDVIKISTGYPSGEYLLIENRQPCGFETTMYQGGLAIFHIDDNANNIRGFPGQTGWPGNGNHYEVALLQADGDYDLEEGYDRGDQYDLFHGGFTDSIGPNGISGGGFTSAHPNTKAYKNGNIINTDVTISNISSAGSTMTFAITIGGTPPSSCSDTTLKFKVIKNDGAKITRDCVWVSNNSGNRCSFDGVSATCPNTCGTCNTCQDSPLRLKITKNDGSTIMRDCAWVSNKNTQGRCALDGVAEACRSTCEQC